MKRSLFTLTVVASLVACGGGGGGSSGGSNNSGNPPAAAQTGVFLDNAVAGIGYRTATQRGITTTLGEYKYLPGETVTFFIGDLELPPVPAKGVVTPADIAAAAHSSDSAAADITKTNILRLLQTLDSDGKPDNGIQIESATTEKFTGDNLPDITSEDFEDNPNWNELVGKPLVSEDDAIAHFERTLRAQLLGSWIFSEGAGKRNVLTFIDAERYIIIHEHDDGESQREGTVEYGTYEWDLEEDELLVRLIGESDEHGGLYSTENAVSGTVTHRMTLDGATLTLGTPSDGEAKFTRVASTTNSFVGAWAMTETYDGDDDNLNVLTFLSSTEYVIAHTNNMEDYTGVENLKLSGEFGTYQLTGRTFQVLGATVDTDGQGGLFNRENEEDQINETLDITPWGDLRFTDDNEGTFSFLRLGSFAAELQDYDSSSPLGIIFATRDASGFNAGYIGGKRFDAEVSFFGDDGSATFTLDFNNNLLEDSPGSGTLTHSATDEESETFDFTWTINSTGAVIVEFTADDESFTMTIAKLVGENTDTKSKILLSLVSEVENSLWESTLTVVPSET